MSNKLPARVIREIERETPEEAETEFLVDSNKWSRAVRSWVREFQARRGEPLPAFDSLFKDGFRSRLRTL